MTTRTVRDWRGIRTQLNRCSDAELINMVANSYATAERIAQFRRTLLDELETRGLPSAAAGASDGARRADQALLAS